MIIDRLTHRLNPPTKEDRARANEIKLLEIYKLSGLLQNLRAGFEIRNILYPGCRYDANSLSEAFSPNEVFYMDSDAKVFRDIYGRFDHAKNMFVEDVADSHFPDQYFDAVFLQDLHDEEKPRNLRGALRMLKVGGLLIHSNKDCGAEPVINSWELRRTPNLRMFPLTLVTYTVYQKAA